MKKHLIGLLLVLLILASMVGVAGCTQNSPIVNVTVVVEPNEPNEPNFADTIDKTIGSVVHVFNNTGGWQGSGVAIRPDLIVTARHVVKAGVDFTITDNNGVEFRATRAISSKNYDVGFIKLDKPVLTPAEFGSIKNCRLGQSVFVIGSPYGKINFNAVSLGIISGLDRDWDEIDPYTGKKYGWQIAFTTDSAGHPGNSGCPVFTTDGVVRGILVGGFSPVLISVMPCDLFLSEVEEIDRMFLMDGWEKEEVLDTRFDDMYYWYQMKAGDTRLEEMYSWYLEIIQKSERLREFVEALFVFYTPIDESVGSLGE